MLVLISSRVSRMFSRLSMAREGVVGVVTALWPLLIEFPQASAQEQAGSA